MGKFKAGGFDVDEENNVFTTDEFETFYNDKDEIPEDDVLNTWAVFLSSPWSEDLKAFCITINCKDNSYEVPEGAPMWRCEYGVTGYDGIYASVFGYGDTEEEALTECKKNLKNIQEKYNKEG